MPLIEFDRAGRWALVLLRVFRARTAPRCVRLQRRLPDRDRKSSPPRRITSRLCSSRQRYWRHRQRCTRESTCLHRPCAGQPWARQARTAFWRALPTARQVIAHLCEFSDRLMRCASPPYSVGEAAQRQVSRPTSRNSRRQCDRSMPAKELHRFVDFHLQHVADRLVAPLDR